MADASGIEIERKFIVAEMPPTEFLQNPTIIHQGYLVIGEDGSEVRLRQASDEGGYRRTLTVKSKGGLVRGEREIDLDEPQFDELWTMTDGKQLLKTRYSTKNEGLTFEIDSYLGNLAGLTVLEIEFTDIDAATEFIAPDWVGNDVTEVKWMKNQALAVTDSIAWGPYIIDNGRAIYIPKVEIIK